MTVRSQPDHWQQFRHLLDQVGGLLSASDLEHRYSISRQRAHQLVHHPTFPDPADVIGQSRVWIADEVDTWRDQRLGILAPHDANAQHDKASNYPARDATSPAAAQEKEESHHPTRAIDAPSAGKRARELSDFLLG